MKERNISFFLGHKIDVNVEDSFPQNKRSIAIDVFLDRRKLDMKIQGDTFQTSKELLNYRNIREITSRDISLISSREEG